MSLVKYSLSFFVILAVTKFPHIYSTSDETIKFISKKVIVKDENLENIRYMEGLFRDVYNDPNFPRWHLANSKANKTIQAAMCVKVSGRKRDAETYPDCIPSSHYNRKRGNSYKVEFRTQPFVELPADFVGCSCADAKQSSRYNLKPSLNDHRVTFFVTIHPGKGYFKADTYSTVGKARLRLREYVPIELVGNFHNIVLDGGNV